MGVDQDHVPSPSSTTNTENRFTFDFIDDSSCNSRSSSLRRQSKTSYQPSGSKSSSLISPSRSDRLDSRYSSRLPPSYSPRNVASSLRMCNSSISSINNSTEDVKTILFQTPTIHTMMDESEEFAGSNTTTMLNTSVEFGINLHASSPRRMSSNATTTSSPRRHDLPPSSPASSIRSSGSHRTGYSNSTNGSIVSSFLNSSPRKCGMITGISSPMSGNLSNPIVSSSSSVPSSPTNSVMMDEGEGDRFIPSRVSSNLNFTLPASSRESRRAASASESGDMDLSPTPSFGASLVGGSELLVIILWCLFD